MSATHEPRLGVVELRRYTLEPGRRDELIDLFDRHFIEPQEAAGISVIGQFRDLDHPDTFTWLRGFTDMDERRRALGAFYGGPVWAEHRSAANATMIDSDDVLLLAPVASRSTGRPDPPATTGSRAFRVVTIHLCRAVRADDIAALTDRLASLPDWNEVLMVESLDAVNSFPALPVRTGEHVVVAVLGAVVACPADPDWRSLGADLGPDVVSTLTFRLEPTAGSRVPLR